MKKHFARELRALRTKRVFDYTCISKTHICFENDNINENTPFYYLTELAAKCTAKRMVPDYVSEKLCSTSRVMFILLWVAVRSSSDRFTEAGVGNIARAKNYVEGKRSTTADLIRVLLQSTLLMLLAHRAAI